LGQHNLWRLSLKFTEESEEAGPFTGSADKIAMDYAIVCGSLPVWLPVWHAQSGAMGVAVSRTTTPFPKVRACHPPGGSYVESHDDLVAVTHDVVFADGVVEVGRFHLAFRTEAQEIIDRHDLGPDETAGQVGMDRSGCVERG
jgi:hypothetical protein